MSTFEARAQAFLDQKNIAVVGVSRSGNATGNAIYKALRDRGYTVFQVNPNADEIGGEVCYRNVQAIPDPVDGVLIVTPAAATEQVVKDCVAAGIKRVWMHGNAMFGHGMSSVSDSAAAYGRENGIDVIDGGCPMMFMDFAHKCMRWVLGKMGKLPQ
jgi:uncharacterized protein